MTQKAKKLGILGGGQLGRMSALAAANLGIETVIFTPESNSPASQVVRTTFEADYSDQESLRKFAESVDVITYEFENIPVETVEFLQGMKPVYPDMQVLQFTQHRVHEKQFLNDHGIPTTRWLAAKSNNDIQKAFEDWDAKSCILKTCRFGYDGKGQTKIIKGDDLQAKWNSLKSDDNIIEELIDFDCEISVIVCRDRAGNTQIYDPVLNNHKNHILAETIAPAPLSDDILSTARAYARRCADALNLVGILALELFVTKDGQLLANEMAPRPHNSGHWTMDACAISQFENHVRCVCGLPVGDTVRHADAVMINLIGDEVALADDYLGHPNACIHLYGKAETRPGRKMGHINLLKPLTREDRDPNS